MASWGSERLSNADGSRQFSLLTVGRLFRRRAVFGAFQAAYGAVSLRPGVQRCGPPGAVPGQSIDVCIVNDRVIPAGA